MSASASSRPEAAPERPRWTRRLRPFELALVAAMTLLLVVAALRSMQPLFAAAERESMRGALADMRSGLMLAATVALVRGDHAAIAALEAANPVPLSPRPLARYAGEHEDAKAATAPRYHWYWDPATRLLVYRAGAPDAMQGGPAGARRARFRVRLAYEDIDADGRFSPGTDPFTGIHLRAVEPWGWR